MDEARRNSAPCSFLCSRDCVECVLQEKKRREPKHTFVLQNPKEEEEGRKRLRPPDPRGRPPAGGGGGWGRNPHQAPKKKKKTPDIVFACKQSTSSVLVHVSLLYKSINIFSLSIFLFFLFFTYRGCSGRTKKEGKKKMAAVVPRTPQRGAAPRRRGGSRRRCGRGPALPAWIPAALAGVELEPVGWFACCCWIVFA